MKYCIDWYGKPDDILNKVDEINIDLSRVKDLTDLGEFLELHKDQRVNLCINMFEDAINGNYLYLPFDLQKEGKYNIGIRLGEVTDEVCQSLKEKYPEAKVFFRRHITDWDTLMRCLDYGVTDVYITEGMGFEIDKIAAVAHAVGVRVRAYPNVAQSSWNGIHDLKKFWIRPEDTEIYEKYIDVYELYGEPSKLSIYYDIYAKDKKWMGNLKEIIIGMNMDINSGCILPRFGEKRTRCNRECLKGGKCQMCDVIFDLSKNLEENDFRITYKKEREDIEDGKRS